jgi:hypothetical protein
MNSNSLVKNMDPQAWPVHPSVYGVSIKGRGWVSGGSIGGPSRGSIGSLEGRGPGPSGDLRGCEFQSVS